MNGESCPQAIIKIITIIKKEFANQVKDYFKI